VWRGLPIHQSRRMSTKGEPRGGTRGSGLPWTAVKHQEHEPNSRRVRFSLVVVRSRLVQVRPYFCLIVTVACPAD
jgi:hypothetical protein